MLVVCGSSAVDSEIRHLSMFNVTDEIVVSPSALGKGVDLHVVMCLDVSEESRSASNQVRLVLFQGTKRVAATAAYDFATDSNPSLRLRILGMNVPSEAGSFLIGCEWKPAEQGEWTDMTARWPLNVSVADTDPRLARQSLTQQ